MAGRASTRLQASGHRFTLRRIERTLLCGEPRPADEPLRPRAALAAGALVAVLALAGCALLAVLRPQPTPGDAPILLGRGSGALYVRIDDTLHPVLNLASARLIAATPAEPRPVRDTDLGSARRGPLLGIPGAPRVLGAPIAEPEVWSVCDSVDAAGWRTTVVVGVRPAAGELGPDTPVLVSTGARSYLLSSGRRIPVDPPAGLFPRRVSGLLVNALPEAPATAVRLPGGVAVLPAEATTLCVTWSGPSEATLWAGTVLPLPVGAAATALAQADGAGPALDAVYLPAGHSAYVRGGGERYLVTDSGVRFPIGGDDDAGSLGLPAQPTPAPWPALVGLPVGPVLSRSDALIARDVLAVAPGDQRPGGQ